MSANEQARRRRLTELMNRSCAEQRTTWQEVSKRGDISVATLRRIRHRLDVELTPANRLGVEAGLRWSPGDVDRVMDGGDYTYRNPPLDPLTSSAADVMEFLKRLKAERREVYAELQLAIIDANWL